MRVIDAGVPIMLVMKNSTACGRSRWFDRFGHALMCSCTGAVYDFARTRADIVRTTACAPAAGRYRHAQRRVWRLNHAGARVVHRVCDVFCAKTRSGGVLTGESWFVCGLYAYCLLTAC